MIFMYHNQFSYSPIDRFLALFSLLYHYYYFLRCKHLCVLPRSLLISLGKIPMSRIPGPKTIINFKFDTLIFKNFQLLWIFTAKFQRDLCFHWYFIWPYLSHNGESTIFFFPLFKCYLMVTHFGISLICGEFKSFS